MLLKVCQRGKLKILQILPDVPSTLSLSIKVCQFCPAFSPPPYPNQTQQSCQLSADSSAPLFTQVSWTYSRRADDMFTKLIIDLQPRVSWYHRHLWISLCLNRVFVTVQIEVSTEVKLQNTSWVQIELIAHVSIPQQGNRVTRRGFPAPQQGQILWIIIWHIIQMTVTHIPRHRDPGKHPSCLMERTPKCRRWIGEYK